MTGPTTDSTQYDIDRALQKKRADAINRVEEAEQRYKDLSPDHGGPLDEEPSSEKEAEVAAKTALIEHQQQELDAAIAAEQAVRQEQM
jgi:hypothetical protein